MADTLHNINSRPQILVTDTVFIFKEHEKRIRDAGFDIVRLQASELSEDKIVKAIKGKVGYILGGTDHITDKVINSADCLKVITFTGIGWKTYIPAWEKATNKGIAISNTPDGPTQEVAEWAVTAALVMNRHFLKLGRAGDDARFTVTEGIEAQKIGIVGLGRIGSRIAQMAKTFNPAEINYYSLHKHPDLERELGVQHQNLSDLLRQNDIIFLCASGDAQGLIGAKELNQMKKDALLVSFMAPGVINEDSLFESLQKEAIRVISDYSMGDRFRQFSYDRFYCMNGTNTLTQAGAKLISDTATDSILNILLRGEDKNIVNGVYSA